MRKNRVFKVAVAAFGMLLLMISFSQLVLLVAAIPDTNLGSSKVSFPSDHTFAGSSQLRYCFQDMRTYMAFDTVLACSFLLSDLPGAFCSQDYSQPFWLCLAIFSDPISVCMTARRPRIFQRYNSHPERELQLVSLLQGRGPPTLLLLQVRRGEFQTVTISISAFS